MNNPTSVKPFAFDPAYTPTPLSVSVKIWLGLVAYLALVKSVITFFPTTFTP